MPKENEEIVLEDKVDEEEVVEEVEPEYSEVELEARKHGWIPKDDFDGEDDDFISAAEYNRRAELFGKIASQKRDIDTIRGTVKQLVEHNRKLEKATREKTIKELQAQKTAAYEQEDFGKVVEIDEQIAQERQANEVVEQKPEPSATNQPNPALEAWKGNNRWYEEDSELAGDADAFAISYIQRQRKQGTQPTTEEVLQYVDKKMKPMLVRGNNNHVSAVEGAGRSRKPKKQGKKTFTKADLNDTQLELMRGIMRADSEMTEKEYIEQLAAIGELH